jgi:hypothetical protein
MVNASLMICGATWVAFCGSPSVSKVFNWTWQPALASLCLSTASWMPFLMLMPSWASGPLSAPAIAIDTGGHCALPSPAGSAAAACSGGGTSFPFSSICTCSTIFRSVGVAPPSLGSDCCWQPAMPITTNPALPIANAFRATRPRTLHLRVNVFVGVGTPAQVGGGGDASGRP